MRTRVDKVTFYMIFWVFSRGNVQHFKLIRLTYGFWYFQIVKILGKVICVVVFKKSVTPTPSIALPKLCATKVEATEPDDIRA